jgi:hypothetical protein
MPVRSRRERTTTRARTGGRIALTVVVVGAMTGACSSSATKATPTTAAGVTPSTAGSVGATTSTTTPSAFATRYLQILGPADAATGTFFTALKALPITATGADAQKLATPAANAIDKADQQLLRVPWPVNVTGAVRALVAADTRLVGDLRDVGAQKLLTSGGWKNQFERDVTSVSGRVSTLVAALRATAAKQP